jgi:hypothetical protein
MRRLRAPLPVLLAIAVVFAIGEAFRVYQFGWPPNDLGYADQPGVIPIATTGDQIAYGLMLFVIGLVQAALLWLVWKAWRAPPT